MRKPPHYQAIGALGRLLMASLAVLAACSTLDDPDASVPQGVAPTNKSVPGPAIIFEPLHRPQPEMPFPNDLALVRRADGAQFLNVSTVTEAKIDKLNREHLNSVEGFSGLTPISVSFDGPLDLTTVSDDSVYVVNVQKDSKHLGEIIPLDLGRGWYPHTAAPHAYFPNDPNKNFDSYVLPPDNKIDSDGDGVPDKWVYHYEVATHTLDIRPLLPLRAGEQYAVVLTRSIKGWDKQGRYGPVHSPFDFVNHDTQTQALQRALPALAKRGIKTSDIAFGWTLTTGDLARTFRALRDGLYGSGVFAWLNKAFPAKINDIYDMEVTFDGDNTYAGIAPQPFPFVAWDSTYTLQGSFLKQIFGLLNSFIPAGGFDHVSHVVFGDMQTVNLRATPDNVWNLDVKNGTIVRDEALFHEKVPFLLIVPKTTAQHKPPFPAVVYAHATGTSRIECLLMADKLAQAGIATFSIDAVGHGPVLADALKFLNESGFSQYLPIIRQLLPKILFSDYEKRFPESMTDEQVMTTLLKHGFMQQLAVKGRATDDDGDCFTKGGEAYYAPNAFRLRDALRQTTLDYIVAVRMLRALGQVPTPPANPRIATKAQLMPSLLAGDYDMDGVLDVGGPTVPYFMTGISLGGIHTALTAPLEPYIVAAAPVVPGAGLADIFMRTRLHGIVTPLVHAISGPKVIACPEKGKDGQPTGKAYLSWNDDSDGCKHLSRLRYRDDKSGVCRDQPVEVPTFFAKAVVPPGALVELTNLTNGNHTTTTAQADGSFAIAVQSDKFDHLRVRVLAGQIAVADVQAVTPYEGLAKERNTPDFRRFVQLAANVLEGADAITVADRVILDPLHAYPHTNMLMMLAVLDQTVPFTTGVTLARAMGLFGRDKLLDADAPYRPWFEKAIATGLLHGKDVTPPPLSPAATNPLLRLCTIVDSAPAQDGKPAKPGKSGLCLADVHGKHEYLAQAPNNDEFPTVPGTSKDKGQPYKGTYTEFHKNLMVNYFHSLGTQILDDVCWGDANCVRDSGLDKAWDAPIAAVP
ncbi:MAG: hypothetical protein EXR77_03360 [Myxococcales bacterium]|nr:hypothetical protein [Myxococcales bacterium]